MARKFRNAFTLIELIFTIVILAIVFMSVILAFKFTIAYSVDPMIMQQAIVIGKSYCNEILSKSFPVGACPSSPTGSRANWTNVCNYNGLSDSGAHDQFGSAITGLGNYTVTVQIYQNSSANLQGLTGSGNQVVRIDVTVTHPDIHSVPFSVYKTNYA